MKIAAEKYEMEEDYDHEITQVLMRELDSCLIQSDPNWPEIYDIAVKIQENLTYLEQAAWTAQGD